jgi:chromosome segregation protein
MHLKRLEVVGFKSFGNKSVFVFDAPITAIVGPNGSGKSNVVESIRFVLGEQSMKSLRGGSSSDLIFKSPHGKSLSRAAVSLVFDNSKREFALSGSTGTTIPVDFDEVELSREVFSDGSSSYKINGISVRLKDILELIGSVNIGSSGHHIISQGEADRLLSASLKERKVMLEEALGLKVYHYRIQESEKKLTKSREHLKEVGMLIKELEPHLKYLKKQVERLDQAETLRSDLVLSAGVLQTGCESVFSQIATNLSDRSHDLHTQITELTHQEQELGLQLETLDETDFLSKRSALEQELSTVTMRESELIRASGKIEARIERLEQEITKAKSQTRSLVTSIPVAKVQPVISEVAQLITGVKGKTSISDVIDSLGRIEQLLQNFEQELLLLAPADIDTTQWEQELAEARSSFGELESDSYRAQQEKQRITSEISLLDQQRTSQLSGRVDSERQLGIIRSKKAEISGQLQVLERERQELLMMQNQKNQLIQEVTGLAGEIIQVVEIPQDFSVQTQLRTVERLKFRYEELGGGVGIEARQEFEQTTERHEFLTKESMDAYQACQELEVLLRDLSEKLEKEFALGLGKINTAFNTYFINMFGGGGAEVRLVEVKSRKKQLLDSAETDDEFSDIDTVDTEEPIEYGVEVRVQLPRKRVQDLAMLSGGERSLTSIALLFALSQVNPPPFVVLDETDAALDEANSRKYGMMLRELSASAELIVVTHNRETMAAAGQLFGVTIGGDGASQVLSVKLEEATQYAK